MAYSSIEGHLPPEYASKSGHLSVIQNPSIQRAIENLQRISAAHASELPPDLLHWDHTDTTCSSFETVISSDGSYYPVESGNVSLVYLKIGAQRLILKQDFRDLHPLLLQDVIQRNSELIEGVLPTDMAFCSHWELGQYFRDGIYRTTSENPEILKTLRWLFTEAWNTDTPAAPFQVQCPHCGKLLDLTYDDIVTCECGESVYATDILGWSVDISREESNLSLATRFMLILELLMLFTCMRQMWENHRELLNTTLFIHDGPLSIGGKYRLLVPFMHRFLRYAHDHGTTVYLMGVEKSGRFISHLLASNIKFPTSGLSYAIPNHGYIVEEMGGNGWETVSERYGHRVLLGDRVFIALPESRRLVITVPSLLDKTERDRPVASDLLGLDRILAQIPHLITPVYDNALYPIVRVNALVSMAPNPSGHLLQLYADNFFSA